jgi:hypothetical protein
VSHRLSRHCLHRHILEGLWKLHVHLNVPYMLLPRACRPLRAQQCMRRRHWMHKLHSHPATLAPGASMAERQHAVRKSCLSMQELLGAPCIGPQASGTPRAS